MPNFNLMQDRYVCIQAESWTQETLDQAVNGLMLEAEQDGEVVTARARLNAAQDYVSTLTRRQVALNKRCLELNARLGSSRGQLRDALAGGEVSDVTDAQLREQGQARALFDGCSEALHVVVSELLPTAKTDELDADVKHGYILAGSILRVATKQVDMVIEQLTPVVENHFVIEFDAWKLPTVSGLLLEHNRIFDLAKQGRESLSSIRDQQKKG